MHFPHEATPHPASARSLWIAPTAKPVPVRWTGTSIGKTEITCLLCWSRWELQTWAVSIRPSWPLPFTLLLRGISCLLQQYAGERKSWKKLADQVDVLIDFILKTVNKWKYLMCKAAFSLDTYLPVPEFEVLILSSSATVVSKTKGRAETNISALCLVFIVKQCNRMSWYKEFRKCGKGNILQLHCIAVQIKLSINF